VIRKVILEIKGEVVGGSNDGPIGVRDLDGGEEPGSGREIPWDPAAARLEGPYLLERNQPGGKITEGDEWRRVAATKFGGEITQGLSEWGG